MIIFHIDVNSAYLSWTSVENLKNHTGPDLRDIPAIIGGDQKSRHGIVLAKSIPAKKFGIYTSEPIVSALRKCPNLVIAPPNHKLYRSYSERLMDYLKSLTPEIEQVSIDECYLDFTKIAAHYASPEDAAREIKDTVYERFGFTVNVGISTNKLLAKMASDFTKPNRVHTLYPNEIEKKMWPLPVEELYMAGHSSVATLHKIGIRTIGELARTDPGILTLHLKSHGKLLWEYANGIDDRPVVSAPVKAKGIGNSTTLSRDGSCEEDAAAVLNSLAQNVSRRLKKAGQLAGNLSVEIKYHTFVTNSHQMPLDPPTDSAKALYSASLKLFSRLWNGEPFRLLGIRTTHLSEADAPVQMNLFDIDWEKKARLKKLDDALLKVKNKYGNDVVHKGPT
ncbi:MAG TPA: DNA polymerase IV [Candidatus Limivivens merdigallinarum]|uniref:DNA polymerase IV n=1 Tax=Candidatus Limivivens merdigallinarum TaxID=2840859 RepID=A0A9D1D1Q3_9FIRM|nr:DNA polymerase IV [Candidatus Limivivens merdigallinarum]